MRVLVTGASGFLGAHLCRRLVSEGLSTPVAVRALVRKTADRSALNGLSIEFSEGDVTDAKSLQRATKDIDVVFHLAGLRRAPTREPFFEVNAEGTRKVCEALCGAVSGTDRRPRFVLCGSLSASGPSQPNQPRREDDPFNPQEWYGESKVEAERIAHSYADRLDVTTIRPCRILGPGDKENLAFFKVAKKGIRLHITGGPRPVSMVDVEDVVDQLLLQATKPEAVGQAFHCAAQETTTLEGMQDIVADELKAKTRTLTLTPLMLKGLASVADGFSRATGRHLPLNRKLAKQLLVPWVCSAEKAKSRLGFTAKRRLEDAIRESARWYVAQGWL